MSSERPRCAPTICTANSPNIVCDDNQDIVFTQIVSCQADFPLRIVRPFRFTVTRFLNKSQFEKAISLLVHHPEYNSTLILRSDTVKVFEPDSVFPQAVPKIKNYRPVRVIHRSLLARRPGRDASLEQYCTFYTRARNAVESTTVDSSHENLKENEEDYPSLLILTPIVPPGESLPYYHPTVHHLAFLYLPFPSSPTLEITAVLLPDTPFDPPSRLYRTSLALLETVYRYGWGALTDYKKRVQHDQLVGREEYQDTYLLMRERHKGLIEGWVEVTDPLKHVYEDIGIATYLMLLWKHMFGASETPAYSPTQHNSPPWKEWPRPPGGFVDLGCGNGLLTHILISEGYQGFGIDVRARNSWSTYPTCTNKNLHVHPLDPGDPASFPFFGFNETDNFDERRKPFLIGNHADELTPYLPLLSTALRCPGYLSIPCCAWAFDERFSRSANSTPGFSFDLKRDAGEGFVESLCLGHIHGGEGGSSYAAYRIWLAALSRMCGWKVECDVLRIPSTRNWAIIGGYFPYFPQEPVYEQLSGRTREGDKEGAEEFVERVFRTVRERGVFRTRKPEGKAGGDH